MMLDIQNYNTVAISILQKLVEGGLVFGMNCQVVVSDPIVFSCLTMWEC